METTDNESCKLRKIEEEIDNYYKSNPLLELPFAPAAWHLLAFAEDCMLVKTSRVDGIQELHVLASEFSCELAHSIGWIFADCEGGGQVPLAFDDSLYEASKDLFQLGEKYESFVFAYTSYSRNRIKLEVKESTIQPTAGFLTSMEYEAYNILIDSHGLEEVLSEMNPNISLINKIQRSLRIQGDRFHYKLNPTMVANMISRLKPAFDRMFLLPSEWQFSRYSLKDFREVFEAICAIAHIHWKARNMAAAQGCGAMGHIDGIYLPTCEELLRRVVRYSGVSKAKVQSILDDLTYGNRGIKHPDPALQPLIRLNPKYYAIVPNLWICSAAERNLTALLNKLPSEREIYAKLVDEKEDIMRQRFITDLSNKGFRFICGRVADLPDVDLAIVSDSEKVCLLLEFKWFIAPTTARERIEKSEEIKKGISQVLKFKAAFAENYEPLFGKLNIDSSYQLGGIVVSQNWIGYADVQSPQVPVIRSDHLIAKLRKAESIQTTMEYLKGRKYLPKEGEHYNKVDGRIFTIGNWGLKLQEIDLLVRDTFFPS